MDELDVLRARVQRLEDERAVLRVLHAYGQSVDSADRDAYLDLWTEDAAFDSRSRNPGDIARVVRGVEVRTDFIEHFSRPPIGWHQHQIIEPIIDVDGDTAQVSSYFAVLREEEAAPLVWVFGRYRDTLVRCPDGRWRFSERIAEVESIDKRYGSLANRWPPAPTAP
jgi:ketosteroid isomerase-like protein